MYEEEQTYVMNGILVESKFDNEEEKLKQKQKVIKQFLQRPSLWFPSNITEFLFCNDLGELSINEEMVKALSLDFQMIMEGVHEELKTKYEKTVNYIMQDGEINGIDFPLIISKHECTPLAKILSPNLVSKLNLIETPAG